MPRVGQIEDPSEKIAFSDPAFLRNVRAVTRSPSGTYLFCLPGRQFAGSGSIKDISGKGADADLQSGITDAQLWARRGYYSGVAANGGKASVPSAKCVYDLTTESVIFSTVLNISNPAGGQSIFGNAAVGFNGFYLSLRPGGAVRPIVVTAAGNFNGLADSTATFATDSDRVLGVAFDALTGEIKLYCDGALSNSYAPNSYLRTGGASPSATSFGLLGQAGNGTPGFAGAAYGTHLLKKTGGLPANLSLVMARLAAVPTAPLSDADLDW